MGIFLRTTILIYDNVSKKKKVTKLSKKKKKETNNCLLLEKYNTLNLSEEKMYEKK